LLTNVTTLTHGLAAHLPGGVEDLRYAKVTFEQGEHCVVECQQEDLNTAFHAFQQAFKAN